MGHEQIHETIVEYTHARARDVVELLADHGVRATTDQVAIRMAFRRGALRVTASVRLGEDEIRSLGSSPVEALDRLAALVSAGAVERMRATAA